MKAVHVFWSFPEHTLTNPRVCALRRGVDRALSTEWFSSRFPGQACLIVLVVMWQLIALFMLWLKEPVFQQFFPCCVYETLSPGSGLGCCFEPDIVLGLCVTDRVTQLETPPH